MTSQNAAIAALAGMLLAGCSQLSPTSPSVLPGPTSAAIDGPAAARTEVPFKGKLEGSFTFVPDSPPSTFASVAFTSVSGQATHLGAFSIEAPHRVDLAILPAQASGTFRLTAANGDILTASFRGVGTPTAMPGVFSIVETATITGGTGRFSNASGSFVIERMVDLNTLFTKGSFDGTITY